MTQRERLISFVIAAVLFVLPLGLMVGRQDPLLDGGLHVQAEAILDGALPYADRGFEYPPLSIPLVIAPGLISDSATAYREAFAWEMIVFGVAIVAMLALLTRGGRQEIWGALLVFVLGVVLLSGLGLFRIRTSTGRHWLWRDSTSPPPRWYSQPALPG